MNRVSVTTAGLDRLTDRITRRANFLGGTAMKALMTDAAKDLAKAYEAKIASFAPGPVQDLKDATKKQKQNQVGFIYPILMRSGYLVSSMRGIAKVLSNGWTIAVDFPGTHPGGSANNTIAKAHIEGTERLPKRDFTAVPARWRDALLQRLRDRLKEAGYG